MAHDDYSYVHEAEGAVSNNKPKLGGSIFVNNTSYSGADIKVVIHTYGQDEPLKKEADEYMKSAEMGYWTQKANDGEIERLNKKLEEVHTNTQEERSYKKKLAGLKRENNHLAISVPDLTKKAGDIYKQAEKKRTKVLAEAQTISISTHRDKQAVRACGSVYPKGFTRGPRQIAGSLVFTVFNEHVLYEFLEAHSSDFDATAFTSALMDQLPPVDILLSFANEYGQVSRMTIYGVEFVNEGQTMSIEDILTENVVQFVARDYDPMRAVSQRELDKNSILVAQSQPKRASDLLLEEDYKAFKDNISPFERFSRRRNPFL